MITLADVRRWQPEALGKVYGQFCRAEETLMHAGDDFISAGNNLGSWQGAASLMAEAEHRDLVSAMDHHVAGLRLLIKSVAEAMDAVPAVQRSITEAEELARKYGFAVGTNGEITDVLTEPRPNDPPPEERAEVREDVRATLDQALRTARDIDSDLARVLRRAGEGKVGTGAETTMAAAAAHGASAPGLTLPEPPAGATAAQNAGWWASLSPNARGLLLENRPGLLGNRDGIPFAVRDQANRSRIPGLRSSLERQRNDILQRLRDAHPPGTDNRTTAVTDYALQGDLEEIDAKLDSLDAIEQTIGRQDHHLLTLNTDAERVEAAVANGNVDTAEHVAVFTPGLNSTVNGSMETYDDQMTKMGDLGGEIQFDRGESGKVATVTWMGYQAPQVAEIPEVTGESVASPLAAARGGEKLNEFLNGIDAARQDNPAHLTAIGHSYGSTTTGIALEGDHPVNDAVFMGSPGFGAQSPSTLRVDGGNMYSEWADGDLVPHAAAGRTLGDSPYTNPDDFRRMSTDANTGDFGPLRASHGHSEYLGDQTTSQYNIAAVVTGHPDMIKR